MALSVATGSRKSHHSTGHQRLQAVRSPARMWRSRVRVRNSQMCWGGIHASGSRPSSSSVRSQRASAQSVSPAAWGPARRGSLRPPPDGRPPPPHPGPGGRTTNRCPPRPRHGPRDPGNGRPSQRRPPAWPRSAPAHLPRLAIEGVEGDLAAVQIESCDHDRHEASFQLLTPARVSLAEREEVSFIPSVRMRAAGPGRSRRLQSPDGSAARPATVAKRTERRRQASPPPVRTRRRGPPTRLGDPAPWASAPSTARKGSAVL